MSGRNLVIAGFILVIAGAGTFWFTNRSDESGPQEINSLSDLPKPSNKQLPDIPELSPVQERTTLRTLGSDPQIKQIRALGRTKVKRMATWSNYHRQSIGAAAVVAFEEPVNIPMSSWPYIENKDELFESDDKDVAPVIGSYEAGIKGVEELIVNVDPDTGKVLAILPIGPKAVIDYGPGAYVTGQDGY